MLLTASRSIKQRPGAAQEQLRFFTLRWEQILREEDTKTELRVHARYLIKGNTEEENGRQPEGLEEPSAMMQQVCPQVQRSREEARNVGWLGETLFGPQGAQQDHWRGLAPRYLLRSPASPRTRFTLQCC